MITIFYYGGNLSNGTTKDVIKKMQESQKRLWKNPEYRQHMIEVHKGKKASEETKTKMSKSNAKYWLGKHLSAETIEKMSNSKKGQIPWNKGTKGVMKPNKTSFKKGEVRINNCKKVRCLETNKTYNSLHEASRELNINVNCIMYVCKGKQKTAGNLHWEYIE